MKRVMVMFVMTVLVMGVVPRTALADPWTNWAFHRSSRGYSGRGDYGYIYRDYGYGSRYGCGPAGYPDRSLWDTLSGETDRKMLEILKTDQEFRQGQEQTKANRDEGKTLFENANQRAKVQKLEDENRLLREKIAELEKKIDQLAAKAGK